MAATAREARDALKIFYEWCEENDLKSLKSRCGCCDHESTIMDDFDGLVEWFELLLSIRIGQEEADSLPIPCQPNA